MLFSRSVKFAINYVGNYKLIIYVISRRTLILPTCDVLESPALQSDAYRVNCNLPAGRESSADLSRSARNIDIPQFDDSEPKIIDNRFLARKEFVR